MKILLLGCNGQLGSCLSDQLAHSSYEIVYSSREHIDITDFQQTKNQLKKISADVIINAAAYTAVDAAEENQKKAEYINYLAVRNIANVCSLMGTWLIHISTDYVFDGTSKIPYKENDITNPQSFYGMTKLKGEIEIESSGCKHIILRTAWVFSEYGSNFLKTMYMLGAKNDELNIVDDQFGCPTYAGDIAAAIIRIISLLYSNKKSGVYHYCGKNACSWYDFAEIIFKKASQIQGYSPPSALNRITTSNYPTPAKRPAYSVLDCSKIASDFNIMQPESFNVLNKVISKLSSK